MRQPAEPRGKWWPSCYFTTSQGLGIWIHALGALLAKFRRHPYLTPLGSSWHPIRGPNPLADRECHGMQPLDFPILQRGPLLTLPHRYARQAVKYRRDLQLHRCSSMTPPPGCWQGRHPSWALSHRRARETRYQHTRDPGYQHSLCAAQRLHRHESPS